jgi:hypothetical protein
MTINVPPIITTANTTLDMRAFPAANQRCSAHADLMHMECSVLH